VKSSLTTVAKQVTKLTRLISELLDLSKIETGKLELVKSIFDLNDMVEETVQDIRYTTNRHAIILRSEFEGKINGDKDRLGQVITNLLNNAIKYSPDTNQVEVILSRNQHYATITVKDQGIGIDEKDQEKIFERFYRAGSKEELTFPGFGIGLFIASEIVSRHNGFITVTSKKGSGAEFVVSLPLDNQLIP
jgi:signal transduction histidine kinase